MPDPNDFTEQFKKAVEDLKGAGEGFWGRLNHPIFGVFIASWLAWNWEVPYLLIKGLDKVTDTIKFINDTYLNLSNLRNLFWVPTCITVGYLLLGPVFKELNSIYRVLVELGGKWIKALIDKIKPEPRFKVLGLEDQVTQLNKEKWSLTAGLNYSENRTIIGPQGNNMSIEQFMKDYIQQEDEIQRLRKSEGKLQADLQLAKDELKLLKKEPDK